ncbi:cytochrome P450 CYP4BN11, partial [Asbolus verrucosus]
MTIPFIAIVLCFCVYLFYKHVYIFNKNLRKFPCPPEVPILGHALDFTSGKVIFIHRNINIFKKKEGHLDVLVDYIKNYGDTVRIKTGPKQDFVDVFESNGKILVQQFEKQLNQNSVNIYPFVTLCTLDIICESAMGTSVKAQENTESEYVRSVKDMCGIIVERAFSPHKMFDSIYYFTEDYKKEMRALKILHSYTNDVIKRRQNALHSEAPKSDEKKKKAFLDRLLEANVGGQSFTIDEIRQEVDTFMFAGHDTTASAISFTLFCLANHSEIQNKVMAEQNEIFDYNFEREVTWQDLKNMKYLELVIKESLRLYPPVPFFARELEEDVAYEGSILPKGLTMFMFVYGIHRNPKVFPEPETFNPNRFESIDGRAPFAFLPFSAGPRNCIEVPILGHALDFTSAKGHLDVLVDYIKNYGDTVRIKTGPKRQLLLTCDYNLLEFVLTSSKILKKSVDYRNLFRWLGTGLLTADAAKWKKHRLIITPTFHYKILEDFVDVFESNGKILVQQFEKQLNQNSVNIYPFVTLCTLDIICESAMGTSVKAQENTESEYVRSVKDMCGIIVERAFSPHKMFDSIYYFTEDFKKEMRALKILHSYTNDVIKRRQNALHSEALKSDEKKKKAFLDHLLEANVGGQSLTIDEIRQEVDTFMFAGHDTTASAISFTLFCLANHPEIQDKVMAEQNEIFEHNCDREVNLRDLKNMKYLELVIKESLRLYPSVPFYAREIDEDIPYQGSILPKGLTITLFVYGIHRNPKFFPEPETFNPIRFESVDGRTPFSFLPFSAGSRNCIGQKFAMAEMKSVVSKVVRTFELLPSIPHHQLKLASETVLISTSG